MTSPTASRRRAGWTAAGWLAIAVGVAVPASLLAGALADASLPVVLAASATRSAMDALAVACVGSALVGALLEPLAGAFTGRAARDTAAVVAGVDRALVVLGAGWLVAVLLGIAVRAADAFGRPVTALGTSDLVRWSTQLAAGRGLAVTAGCAAVVLGCGIARVRAPDPVPVRVPLIAALLGVLTPAITGHASSDPDHQLTVAVVAVHAGAAALWVGGLGAVLAFTARHRALLAEVVPRFSRLAGVCLVAVGLTGVVNAQLRLGSWAGLLGTGYGWLVLAKAALLVALAVLGGAARRRIAAGRGPVLRWAGLEVALMAATVGLAAALTQTG